MREWPKVTIITPAYNRAGMIGEVIESIAAQNYPNLEHIVVDDGSKDNTREVVAKYPHVTYIYQDNKGEAGAVNTGWQAATGEFVCVVNSDDPQPPGLIHRSVEVMLAQPDVVVTYPDWWMLKGEKRIRVNTQDYDYHRMLMEVECVPGPGAFLRIGKIRPTRPLLRDLRYYTLSDLDCWMRIGQMGPFKRIAEPLGQYVCHPGTQTSTLRGKVFADVTIETYRNFVNEAALPTGLTKDKLMAVAHAKAAMWCIFGAKRKIPFYLWKAFAMSPLTTAAFCVKRTIKEICLALRGR